DIKPDNIIIVHPDRAVLIDFGAAREFIAGQTARMTGILTAEYAPYEQYLSKAKRFPATDFYALCASFYE
ncbi:MAG: serine/threonine protein kinase, partial [Dolichospermum sp.]